MTMKHAHNALDKEIARRRTRDLAPDADDDAPVPALALPVPHGGLHAPGHVGRAAVAPELLRLQQIHGNQAVQRMVRAGSDTSRGGTTTIQREDDDEGFLPSWDVGDWSILPPKPATSTDDRYDTPQNQDRAERRDEDARSNDPNPYEWWTPQQPGDAGPLLPTNESSPVQNELPPPEPDQPGDYPSPLPSEEERYA